MNPLVIPIIFVAMFIQSLTGFGSALIAMPFLIAVLGADVARPVFILVGQTAGLMFMYEYRSNWQFADVKLILVGTLMGIPIGTWVASRMQEDTFMLVLGIILISYATYALSSFTLPQLKRGWGTLFGLFSGILHSAYNVGGPPLVMYNTTQDWEVRRFKGNTQAVFFVTGFFVIFEHIRLGNITTPVLQNYFIMAPTMAIALLLGFRLERYIKQAMFRKILLGLLFIIGLSLVNPF